jgi:alkyl sulfatase BDS1-like metallo-beta-lactamase superfamily hydrolase
VSESTPDLPNTPQPASDATRRLHEQASAVMSFDDPGDFERAQRGLIAEHETGKIELGSQTVWDVANYDFVRERQEAPDTVHPGLWRQASLNCIHGLFKVAEGVWQVRGYDLANITFIAGDDGWVIIDPLTTAGTAAAALALANQHLGARRVGAVIYTHSHVDHYGGVLGVTNAEEVAAGNVRILAPDGFLREAVNENIIAGPAMTRRALFQFGVLLPKGPRGQVDAGLGKGLPAGGPELIAPTETIYGTGTELDIDGIRVVFQNTPDAEAPSEMNFHFPDKRLLCMAENCTHTLHNLYPIRGAQVRDALAWSKYINEALYMFGDESDVTFSSHHWPRFGQADVREFLERQRDVYRWLNDQTLRLANRGETAIEIAEALTLPECFHDRSDVRGYYGTVSHNVKSVYARTLGWYDANPANLQPLPPEPAGARYVEFMGGSENVLRRARACFEKGEYRWVAQVLNHVVFAEPGNQAARALQADTFEQLGYQAESATWRNAYLNGAKELRHGPPPLPLMVNLRAIDAMTAEQVFDLVGVRFDPEAFTGEGGAINIAFSDLDEQHVLGIGKAAIHFLPGREADDAVLSVRLTRSTFAALITHQTTLDAAVLGGDVELEGDPDLMNRLIAALETSGMMYPVVEP